jgi:hypothetical protein
MPVRFDEEFMESLAQMRYDFTDPVGRYLMNRWRRKHGLRPLTRSR